VLLDCVFLEFLEYFEEQSELVYLQHQYVIVFIHDCLGQQRLIVLIFFVFLISSKRRVLPYSVLICSELVAGHVTVTARRYSIGNFTQNICTLFGRNRLFD